MEETLLPLLLLLLLPDIEEEEEEERRGRFRRPPLLREAVARALERRAWRWARGRSCCCCTDAERRLAAAGRRPGCRRNDMRVMVRGLGAFRLLFRPAPMLLSWCS